MLISMSVNAGRQANLTMFFMLIFSVLFVVLSIMNKEVG